MFLGFPQDNDDLKINTAGCIMPHTEVCFFGAKKQCSSSNLELFHTLTRCQNVYFQAKIVDPNSGRIVPLGASGELMTRGYCVMLGYWDDPQKTREVISEDHWYRTG